MPTLRSAFPCALLAILFFSCNTKTKSTSNKNDLTVTESTIVKMLPKESLDIQALHTKFIEAATQHFSVSAKKISLLKSKGGLKITVNPSVLEKEDGSSAKGDIDINIIELTGVNDLFKSNAATVSNGKLLISGGSYFIEMRNDGNKLRIKNGQALQVEFPLLQKEDMELFYGERDSAGNMN